MFKTFLHGCGRVLIAILTEADNKTPSAFRVSALVVTGHMMMLQYHSTVTSNLGFDAMGFGGGVAAVWAAAGIGERIAHYGMGDNIQ
jgi:hypothetical protein